MSGDPDLTVDKTNSTGGEALLGETYQWTLAVSNDGTGPADFGDTEVILHDDLPVGPTSSPVFPTPLAVTPVGTPTGTIVCTITGTTLECVASGPVSIDPTEGVLDLVRCDRKQPGYAGEFRGGWYLCGGSAARCGGAVGCDRRERRDQQHLRRHGYGGGTGPERLKPTVQVGRRMWGRPSSGRWRSRTVERRLRTSLTPR